MARAASPESHNIPTSENTLNCSSDPRDTGSKMSYTAYPFGFCLCLSRLSRILVMATLATPAPAALQSAMGTSGKIFAQDDKFWKNYSRGRPKVPGAFWDRVFGYHQSKGGLFGTVHDIGAGNGPYAQRLHSRFAHVIVSDIVAENITLASDRLRDREGFSFRIAALEEADDITDGSVDMVFSANVMHFAEPQEDAMATIACQLRPGGTFVASLFGPARFRDAELQDLWERISHQGGRELLQVSDDPDQIIKVMVRTQGLYNVAPLDRALFGDNLRIHINMEHVSTLARSRLFHGFLTLSRTRMRSWTSCSLMGRLLKVISPSR
ncbi:conserved hypothetical protein [Talaromyces stipitatus ATCC 10500]|uniref:Methyltransferase type 11 domain-containing protein n=1 Tax=Talaromyces stipitatus (strain ATCC 10500 / CBS 375.48 / QM 6759 / NRRL 1006) TaxID=441959 RepID=B8MLT1_TALSN|nr:uncharacterized protein TSTA_100430 [Talaromyces stipitatus ATCC 10500]EED13798.1 conserved hypothetical protein [Talaromyces stipitatus ATCC 10500]